MVGRELRVARVLSGKTQKDVARAIGCSGSEVSRREHGRSPTLNIIELSRHAAAVGLRCSVSLWPAIRRPLDAAQLALLERFHKRIATSWSMRLEVPMPIVGDLRAADAVITGVVTCLVEAITRLADVQAQLRAAQVKARDLKADRIILLVAATTANRASIRAAGTVLQETLPVGTQHALSALAQGRDPGGDALIVL
jgi:transcriptional regulator with XRE-family HTH domain